MLRKKKQSRGAQNKEPMAANETVVEQTRAINDLRAAIEVVEEVFNVNVSDQSLDLQDDQYWYWNRETRRFTMASSRAQLKSGDCYSSERVYCVHERGQYCFTESSGENAPCVILATAKRVGAQDVYQNDSDH